MRMALARLGLDLPLAGMAVQSAFFRRTPQPSTFRVPPSHHLLGLDLPLAGMAVQSAFFRRTPQPSTFRVPPSHHLLGSYRCVWFLLLHSLFDRSPWQLPKRLDLLSQLEGSIWHPNPSWLQLTVWPLKGQSHF